jgi:hypothetical protein
VSAQPLSGRDLFLNGDGTGLDLENPLGFDAKGGWQFIANQISLSSSTTINIDIQVTLIWNAHESISANYKSKETAQNIVDGLRRLGVPANKTINVNIEPKIGVTLKTTELDCDPCGTTYEMGYFVFYKNQGISKVFGVTCNQQAIIEYPEDNLDGFLLEGECQINFNNLINKIVNDAEEPVSADL